MEKNSTDFRVVILAGGSGERFWPLSTPAKPKQFLNVFGGESLIRQSFTRLGGLVGPEDTFVITASRLVSATKRELPELPPANIVGEPMRRDTGAAVALGVGVAGVAGVAGDPVIGFFPSDQLVTKPAKFRAVVKEAIALAKKRDAIVTLGIRPTYPATGFGYIDPKSGTFVEKPNVAKAKRYVENGYLWNAGMFIARASVFRAAFAAHAPDLSSLSTLSTPSTSKLPNLPRRLNLSKRYAALPRISFDYAVMEKFRPISVVSGDFGWDDVGGYAAFDTHFQHDAAGNVTSGAVKAVESAGSICVQRGSRITVLGVKDIVVVTAGKDVLVVPKSRVGELKKLFTFHP